jgi:phosphoenolpyruvate carboxykinase (GTP)
MPSYEDLDWNGLDFSKEQFEAVMSIDPQLWLKEIDLHGELFEKLNDRLPKELAIIKEFLTARLERAQSAASAQSKTAEPLKAAGTAE